MTHAARVALAALLVAGCTKSLHDLQPYPCPTGFPACPDNVACVHDQCVTPFIDAPCNDFTDCSLGADGAVCLGGACNYDSGFVFGCDVGACLQPCGAGGACDLGRVCTTPGADGLCVVDCGAGQSCPEGLACAPIPNGRGGHGCVPPTASLHWCASVEVATSCMQCGAANFITPCPGSTNACPLDATCTADAMSCNCDNGFAAYDCSDVECAGCSYPNYYCRPTSATRTPGCGDNVYLTSGACHCTDGRSIPFVCSVSATCESICASS